MSTLFTIIIAYFGLKWLLKSNNRKHKNSTYNKTNFNSNINNYSSSRTNNSSSSISNIETNNSNNNNDNLNFIPINANINNMPTNTFIPNSTRFKAEINTGQYVYNYIYDYFPVSRFSLTELSSSQINERYKIYEFKNGTNPLIYADIFASACINKFGSTRMREYTVLIIPASNMQNTKNRFEVFLDKFCKNTGAINGFRMLRNSSTERNPQHNGGTPISRANITFEGSFSGKKFLIIDDVRTRGGSSNLIYQELRLLSASEIVFCYLGRTIPLNINTQNFTPNINNVDDDLPF
jgi:hypothetical protein